MSQADLIISDQAGADFLVDLNAQLMALGTLMSGASAPSTTYARMLWADTNAGLLKQRDSANAAWIIRGTLSENLVAARAANTALGVSDFGRVILASGTFTQTFDAVATLPKGWKVLYKNTGSGVITFDPAAAETVDGVATVTLGPGESCAIYSDGAALYTLGRPPASVARTNVAQTFTATQVPDNGTGTAAAGNTYTFDGADQVREITVTGAGAITFGAPTGVTEFALYIFKLKAGDTSSRTFAWNAAYKFPAGVAPLTSGTTTNGAKDTLTFIGGPGNTLEYQGHQADLR